MNYHTIKKRDILNGPGFRTILFVSGCDNHCEGCHNPETWDPESGIPFTDESMNTLIESLYDPLNSGLTISGGDPLYKGNIDTVTDICKRLNHMEWFKSMKQTIWVYTGSLYEDIKDLDIMDYIDVVVDGPYIADKFDDSLVFKGSKNQRLIDVKKSKTSGKIELYCTDNI